MARMHNSNLRMRRLRLIVLLGLVLAFLARFAAAAGGHPRVGLAQDSIPAAQLANWEPINGQALLVWTLHDSRAHLIRLDRPIPGLLGAATIYVITHNHDPNIRAHSLDELIAPGAGAARIVSLQYLSEKLTAELDRAASMQTQATTAST